MKVLIIYEEVPETTKFYAVEVTDKEWKWMQKTHGHLVNCVNDKAAAGACDQLTTWLEKHTPFESKEPIRTEGFDYVLHTGFLL